MHATTEPAPSPHPPPHAVAARWRSASAPATEPAPSPAPRSSDRPPTDARREPSARAARDGASPTPRPEAPDASPAAVGRAPSSAPRIRPSWAAQLLATDGDARGLARRGLTGVALASAYGLALGAREGGVALLVHAAGVPAALAAVTLLGLPALYIVLALFDAPLSPREAAGAAARGLASAGLVLAGVAPLAALYVVTSASAEAASLAAVVGLGLGGLLGLRHLVATLREALVRADTTTRFMAGVSQVGFGLFAVLLAWRVWGALLPLVGGA